MRPRTAEHEKPLLFYGERAYEDFSREAAEEERLARRMRKRKKRAALAPYTSMGGGGYPGGGGKKDKNKTKLGLKIYYKKII